MPMVVVVVVVGHYFQISVYDYYYGEKRNSTVMKWLCRSSIPRRFEMLRIRGKGKVKWRRGESDLNLTVC